LEWFENGNKKIEFFYKEDNLEGKYEEWLENGKKIECFIKMIKKDRK